tara:strand:+ start:3424 stop:3609 length:186 start_codon:yes stop_codon:yes gene_type:complete
MIAKVLVLLMLLFIIYGCLAFAWGLATDDSGPDRNWIYALYSVAVALMFTWMAHDFVVNSF